MDKIKDFADEHTYQTYILPNLLLKAGGVGGGGVIKMGTLYPIKVYISSLLSLVYFQYMVNALPLGCK